MGMGMVYYAKRWWGGLWERGLFEGRGRGKERETGEILGRARESLSIYLYHMHYFVKGHLYETFSWPCKVSPVISAGIRNYVPAGQNCGRACHTLCKLRLIVMGKLSTELGCPGILYR